MLFVQVHCTFETLWASQPSRAKIVRSHSVQYTRHNTLILFYVPLICDGYTFESRMALSLAATNCWPGCGRLAWMSWSNALGVPIRTSMDIAVMMSACLAMMSARWRASAPIAVMNCVPLMREIPCDNNTSIKTITKIVQGTRDGGTKKSGNKGRLEAMGHPLIHHFDAGPSFHFGSQNNVAGMLHYDNTVDTSL